MINGGGRAPLYQWPFPARVAPAAGSTARLRALDCAAEYCPCASTIQNWPAPRRGSKYASLLYLPCAGATAAARSHARRYGFSSWPGVSNHGISSHRLTAFLFPSGSCADYSRSISSCRPLLGSKALRGPGSAPWTRSISSPEC